MNAPGKRTVGRWVLVYLIVSIGITVLCAISDAEDYRNSGGTRIWEPIVWEASLSL